MWDRYCRGADAILYVFFSISTLDGEVVANDRYVVDAADVSLPSLVHLDIADIIDEIPPYGHIRITCPPWSTFAAIRSITRVGEQE
jgi:hypothetical protein